MVTTPKAAPSLVQQLYKAFTQRKPRRRDGLQDDTLNTENDALRRRYHHHQQEAGETFARRIPSLAARPHPGKPRKSSRASGTTVPPRATANLHLPTPRRPRLHGRTPRPHELPHRSSLPHTAAHGRPQPQPEQARRTRPSRPAGLVAPPHPRLRGPACAHAGRRTSTRRSRLHEPTRACAGRRAPPRTSERRTGAPCAVPCAPTAPSRAPPKCLTPPLAALAASGSMFGCQN